MKQLFVWIATILAVHLYGQNCNLSLSGHIIDFHDGSSLQGAFIRISELEIQTVSNQNGNFQFNNLCEGNYTVLVSHEECTPKQVDVSLQESQRISVQLEHHIEELEEVKIQNNSNRTNTKTGQESTIKVEAIEDYSSASLGDAIQEISGVSSLITGGNIVKPVIHGLHSSRVSIINNGVRMQDQEWGIEHAPNVDVNSAELISVVKGATALEYGGDALGGAVIIKPLRIPKKDSLFGKTIATFNSNNRGGTLSTTLTKSTKKGWYVSGNGTYKRFGDFKSPDYVLSNTGVDSKAFSVRTGFKSFEKSAHVSYSYIDNELGILSASHIGGIEDLIRAIESPIPLIINDWTYGINQPKQRVRHHIAKAELEKRFSKLGKLSLQYDYQRNHREEFDLRRGDRDEIPAVDLLLQTHGLHTNFLFDKNFKRKFKVGIDLQYQDNFADPSTGVRRIIPDYERYDAGIFATTEWKLENQYLIEASLRYDYNHINAQKFYNQAFWNERGYNNEFADWVIAEEGFQFLVNPVYDFHNVSFAIGVNKKIGSHTLILNYGLSNRAPNPSELFSDGLHQSTARVELGDLRLDKETSNRISAVYEYSKPKLNLLVEPYFNHISNYIFTRPSEQGFRTISGGVAFFEYEFQKTDAIIYGVDFGLDWKISEHFSFNNDTAFLIGKNLNDDEPLIDMPPFNTINEIQYQNKNWLNFKASVQSQWFLQQNNYPDFNFIYTDPFSNEMTLVDVSTPPDAYNLFNFRSSISTQIFKKSTLEIGFNIQNIFNTNYRSYLNRLRFFADETGRNFQLQLKINY